MERLVSGRGSRQVNGSLEHRLIAYLFVLTVCLGRRKEGS